jgi:diguanylate cyclase (GGDEF)-like protein
MSRRVTPQLGLLLILLLVVISGLVASNRYFQDRTLVLHDRAEQIVRNIERIHTYDEILTGSARLAAATGDPAFERRYNDAAPELDAVIAQTLKLVNSPQAEAAIATTSDANQALIKMETRAFTLGRSGRRREASALLTSSQYAKQKAIYAQGSEQAATLFRATVSDNTAQVRRYRTLALGIGILGGAILLLAGIMLLRLARERERIAADHDARTVAEAQRRAGEVEYFESQHHFTDILQVTRREPEAHTLIKRHLERTIPGGIVAIVNRNEVENRLDVVTPLPDGSAIFAALDGAEPGACAAVRLGRAHEREPDGMSLLECELCGRLSGPSLCAPSLVGGEVIGAVLVACRQPITEDVRRRVEQTVAQAAPVLVNLRNLSDAEDRAVTDSLTGLPNKRSIEDTLKRMAAQANRSHTTLAAIMLDLDHFKRVNDLHGHARGDEVLTAVGAAIKATLRDSDYAGRYGGEEFLILLPDTTPDGALTTAARLLGAIADLRIATQDLSITASLGVALMPDDADTGEDLFRLADRALYAAKHAGRNRIESAHADTAVLD